VPSGTAQDGYDSHDPVSSPTKLFQVRRSRMFPVDIPLTRWNVGGVSEKDIGISPLYTSHADKPASVYQPLS
jgi:hypothetical protein